MMFQAFSNLKNARNFALAVTAAVACLVCGSAANAGPLSFSTTFSEDPSVAADPTNMMSMMMAMWQTPHSLLVQRGQPTVKLTVNPQMIFDSASMTNIANPNYNASLSPTTQLSSFTLTIGKSNLYNFDFSQIVSADPGVTVTYQSLSSTPMAAESTWSDFSSRV